MVRALYILIMEMYNIKVNSKMANITAKVCYMTNREMLYIRGNLKEET